VERGWISGRRQGLSEVEYGLFIAAAVDGDVLWCCEKRSRLRKWRKTLRIVLSASMRARAILSSCRVMSC
jgi:hypothetical protein